jgi:hypothetical protein
MLLSNSYAVDKIFFFCRISYAHMLVIELF